MEPFCGGAWVYFTKPPSKVEILNDFDGELVNFWKVVRHHLPEFLRYLEFTLVSREEFKAEQKLDPVPDMKELKVYTVGRKFAPFRWNPLRPPPNVHPQTWIQILADVLEKTHVSGQGVADVIGLLEFEEISHSQCF